MKHPAVHPVHSVHPVHHRVGLGLTLALALTLAAPAAHAAVEDAVPWLAAQAQADGSFSTLADVAVPYQATAETLRAFTAVGEPGVPAALAFLNAERFADSETLARRVLANAEAGNDVSTPVAELLAAQNADGGFGERSDHHSTVLDTAFALEALTAAGQASSAAATSALLFLFNAQQADGSWSDAESASAVYATALTAAAMAPYRYFFDLSAPLASAADYLLARRRGDGTIGETFETALALLAVAPITFDAAAYQDVVAALAAGQGADGSWGGDVYATALAVRALTAAAAPGAPDPTLGAIAGRVVDAADGAPLAGVDVTVAGSESRSTSTAADGTYTFADVAPGAITLTASRDGYHGASASGTVVAGQTLTANLALVPQPPPPDVTIFGTVVDAQTSAPLAGATISVSHDPRTAVSGADGAFRLEDLPAGSFGMQVTLAGYQPLALTVSAPGGGLVGAGALALSSAPPSPTGLGTVAGTVSDEATGAPLAGATVALSGADNRTAATDAAGAFSFTGVQPGDVTLAVSAAGYHSATATGVVVADQTLSALLRLPQVVGPSTVTISGTVVDADSLAPLPGATVEVLGLGFVTEAGGDGGFEIDGIPAGDVAVEISEAGYVSVTYSISAPDGGTASLGTVALAPVPPPSGNRDPVISSTAPAAATVGRTYAYDPVAADPDGDPIVFGLSELPSGMTIEAASGRIRWIPTLDQVGEASFTLVVLDDRGGRAEEQVTVTVSAGGSRSYVITDLETLAGFRIDELAPDNYVLGTYVSGATPGFVVGTPPCPLTWFSAGSDVPASLAALDRLGAQPHVGRDIVMDMGQPFTSVIVFPQVDHGPLPEEGIEYTVWGASSPDAPFPDGWTLATLVTIFGRGWFDDPGCTGAETDDDAGLYTFGLESFRYVRLRAEYSISIFFDPSHTTWNSSNDESGDPGWQSSEAEIDAVGGMVCDSPPIADAGADVVAVTGEVVRFDATGSLGDIRTYGWDLDGDREIDLTGAEADWTFTTEVDADVTLLVVDTLGCVGTDTVHVTVDLARPKPDLTVEAVDAAGAAVDGQSLEISGLMDVTVGNSGTLDAPLPALLTLFEDRNGNATFDPGVDNELGAATMPVPLAEGAELTFAVPVFGHVVFRGAPILAMVDSDGAIDELREDNNVGSTTSACEVVPDIGTFEPVLKWAWSGSPVLSPYDQVMSIPIIAPLEDTNGDGAINERDVPSVVFHTYRGANYVSDGVLRAVSGSDGRELWTVTDPAYRTKPEGSIAVADIDGDGVVEIIAPRSGSGMIAFEHDGAFKWQTGAPSFVRWGGASIADLDADGTPEIVVGNTVLNADGSPRWQGNGFSGRTPIGPLAAVADINLDGSPEVVVGAAAYSSAGARLWQNDTAGDGLPAIGNFDDDRFPEIVVVSRGRVTLLDHAGAIVWGPLSIPGGGNGGAPTVADMDGDGRPEIGVAGSSRYVVFDTDGSVLWAAPTRDFSSNVTGSSVFDFDGDGQAEVVYADEFFLRVYRGTDGTVLFQTPNTSGTTYELPVIVDVDNDAHADIVVCTNTLISSGGNGIRVFQDRNNSWVNTRKIWNQHAYHITNINDDGTVPAVEANSWEVHNTYRLNTQPGISATALADLTASFLRIVEGAAGEPARLVVRIGNGGARGPLVGVSVAFYEGDPAAGGTLLGSVAVPDLASGAFADVELEVDSLTGAEVWAVVDPDDLEEECDEGNNSTRTPGDARATTAVIAVATDAPFYAPSAPVDLRATVVNPSGLAGEFVAALSVDDAAGVVVAAFPARATGLLPGMQSLAFSEGWNTADFRAGTYRLRGTVSTPEGVLLDEAVAAFEIRASDTGEPEAAVRVTTDRPVYHTSDRVELLSVGSNLTVNVQIDDAVLALAVTGPGGSLVPPWEVSLGQLAPRTVRGVDDELALAGAAVGVYTVTAVLLDGAGGALLAQDQTSFEVVEDVALALVGDVAAALPELFVGDDQTCTATLSHGGTLPVAGLETEIVLVGVAAELVAASEGFVVDLAAGDGTALEAVFATDDLEPEIYVCALRARIDGEWRVLDTDAFRLNEPPIKIEGTLRIGDRGRVLVLLDAAEEHGPRGAPSGAEQRQTLERLLTAAGWSYTIVTTAEDFLAELRTGGYALYALFSEQERLPNGGQKELREAVYRGEGLLVAGAHDQRHSWVEDALGIRYRGQDPHATGVELGPSAVHPGGQTSFAVDDNVLRVDLAGAEPVASFEGRGKAEVAAATYDYGEGRSVYAGFDLLLQATAAGGEGLLAELLLGALAHAHPPDLLPRSGGVLPLHVELENLGIATPGRVVLPIPDGVTVVDAGGTDTGVDGELIWPFDLVEEQVVGFDAWVRLPDGPATLAFTASVQTGEDPDFDEHVVLSLEVGVPPAPAPQEIAALVATAQAAGLSDADYKKVLKSLDKAVGELVGDNPEKGLRALLDATDELLGVTSLEGMVIRTLIDELLLLVSGEIPAA